MSARQRQIVSFALQYVGYPYVWGGTCPTPDSPYGRQAHGGFDCSGFVWWVLKMNFGYAIPNSQRTAAAMAAHAKPRIPLAKLKPCDIIFFGAQGPQVERRLGLPHRHLPGQRLVYRVLERLRWRHPGQPELAGLVLRRRLRLGQAGADRGAAWGEYNRLKALLAGQASGGRFLGAAPMPPRPPAILVASPRPTHITTKHVWPRISLHTAPAADAKPTGAGRLVRNREGVCGLAR